MNKLSTASIVLLAALTLGREALAAGPAQTRTFGFSPYEMETRKIVTERLGAQIDPTPQGKTIESIGTVRLAVFEKRDFLPEFVLSAVNFFHATSRAFVIEREVLTSVGEKYDALACDETERNLRALTQLSLVLIVPLKGSTADKVKILVITKDVWSLRVQWDIGLTSGGLEKLILQPSEINLGGIHHTAGGTFVYQPLSTSLGLRYTIPRVGDSRVQLNASGNVIVNNVTGSPEGSFGLLSIGQPLWSTRTEWAASASAQWRDEITRRYSGGQLAKFDSKLTPEKDDIPDAFRSAVVQAFAGVTRSFGWAYKNDFVLSFEVTRSRYHADDLSPFNPIAVADFKRLRLPVSDDRIGPAIEWRSYTTEYTRVLDLETLGLQEDIRLGHWFTAKVYPVSQNLGSTRTFLGLFAEAGYTLPIHDGVARVDLQSTTEWNDQEVLQGVFQANAYLASPRTPIGRFVWSALAIDRWANDLNTTSTIGGNNRLRGFPTSYYFGKDLVASNLEFRSRNVDLFKVHFGGVLFYDVADAFDGWKNLHPHHSVGFGLRVLFPQFDRVAFRADVGFPISRTPTPDIGPVSFFLTFAQAFPLPQFGPPTQQAGTLAHLTTR